MPWNKDGSRKGSALYKKSSGFKMSGWSPFTKISDDKKKVKKKDEKPIKRENWVPAWPGADISKQKWDSMTSKEKKDYTDKYGD